jgi:hypothetical protein
LYEKGVRGYPLDAFFISKNSEAPSFLLCFLVSDDGLFGKLHLRRSAAPRALRRTFSTPPVYMACSPSTSESSTPSLRPLTPVFRYAPENGNWRSLSNWFSLCRHVLRPSVAYVLKVSRVLRLTVSLSAPTLVASSCIKNHSGSRIQHKFLKKDLVLNF